VEVFGAGAIAALLETLRGAPKNASTSAMSRVRRKGGKARQILLP
jgi:hypothetical protein